MCRRRLPPPIRLAAHSILLLALGWTPAFAEAGWIQIQSPHFTVVSNAGAEAAAETALHFEQIREAFRQALPEANTDPGQPIVVLAVKDEASLRELLPQYWERAESLKPAGVFLAGPERHYVALRLDVRGPTPYRTLYHEYFHLLLRINHPLVPVWLNEGLAEFYAQTRISGDGIQLGLPSQAHIARLRSQKMLPLRTFFAVDHESPHYNEASQASIFYSQAWALTHYLMTAGRGSAPTSPIDELLALIRQGVRTDQATRMALGAAVALEQALTRYVAGDEFHFYTYPLPLNRSTPLRASSLTPSEALSIRAAFLARNDRPAEAQQLIYRALSSNPNEALAYESLGYLHYRSGDRRRAFDAFARAVELDSASYLSHYLFAHLAVTEKQETDPSRARVEPSLREAIRLRPGFPYSYAALARHLLSRQEKLDEAPDLAMEACRLEPSNRDFLQTLGYSLLAVGRMEEARQVVERLEVLAASAEDRRIAAALASRIEEPAGGSEAGWAYDFVLESEGSDGAPPGRIPSSLIREAEGTFASVRCQAPAVLELTLEGHDGILNLISRDYTVVEYIVPGQGPFHPCEELQGKAGKARFFEDQEEGLRRLLGVMISASN